MERWRGGTPAAAPGSERTVRDECMHQLARHLPPAWRLTMPDEHSAQNRAEAVESVVSPHGEALRLAVHVRRSVVGRDVAGLAGRFADSRQQDVLPVLAADYLSPTVRDRLRAAEISHVDTTGNIWLTASRPGIFILAQGASSDPWRSPGRPRGTLKGVPAAKVVRALLDFSTPWSVRDLIERSGASVGATYRVLDYLEREGLINRRNRSAITVPSWRELLEAWARDYDFFRAGHVSTYLTPRGLTWLTREMAETDGVQYALTGSLAVPAPARYAPSRVAMVYVENAAAVRERWDLRPASSGQNVLVCEAPASAALQRARPTNDPDLVPSGYVMLARPAQVAVDLMAAPGRGPEEAKELLEWMEANEPAWRE